jgi:hypothetical protein
MTADPYTAERRTPQHGSANPYATYVDLDAPQSPPAAAPPPAAAYAYTPPPMYQPAVRLRPSRGIGKILAAVAVVVAVGGVGAAYGVTAYGKSKICDLLATASGPNAPKPAPGEEGNASFGYAIGYTAPKMHRSTRLLIFDGTLQDAVENLYADTQRVAELQKSGALHSDDQAQVQQAVFAVGNLDGHLRDTQRACGQPVTGVVTE